MADTPKTPDWYDLAAIGAQIEALESGLVEIRHDIHRHPELGFEEHRTQNLVRGWLEEHGYDPQVSAETGLFADLRPELVGKSGARTIGLRADLDCLPMDEMTDLPYRSVHAGRAHKCGHDGHTTMLMGTAAILASLREKIDGNVRLLFQPAEEGVRGGGAKVMVAEGVLDPIDEVYGLHNWPGYPRGQVRVKPGAMMAHTHSIRIRVTGVGGHGSQPQLVRDPIVAASHLVVALQTVVSRGLSYDGGAVVSIGKFEAGTTDNVIPDEAHLLGTIRSFSPAVTERVLERIHEVATGIATTFGVQTDVQLTDGYPVLINDDGCAEAVARVATRLYGADAVTSTDLPMAGGEDFSYMAQAKPAAYFFIGTGDTSGTTPGCHHPDFDFEDRIIPQGMAMFLGLVADRLS
jgi:amidohydrolase